MSRSSIKYLRRSVHSVGFLSCFLTLVSCVGGAGGVWAPATDDPDPPEDTEALDRTTGHLNFESPHSRPIAVHPAGDRVYVVNTPSDTVDVIDTESYEILARIRVGVEPVGIGI